ncbi:MAG: transporter [Candidatus Tectomicrobia bacterium]|nr:transporter [Candidatus Tectomicrobia bacterium]
MHHFTRSTLLGLLGLVWLALSSSSVLAAEGGSSLYIPGLAGDIALAVSSEPGLQVGNSIYVQTSSVDRAVLQGVVNAGLDVDVVLNFFGGFYTFKPSVLGGTYSIGAVIPFGYAELDAQVTGPRGNSVGVSGDTFSLADIAFVPLRLNWNIGDFHFKFFEAIIAPTGDYDVDDVINLGRNYWAFDTVAAFTWLSTKTGTEFSMEPGLLANTRNDDTEYTTGLEFHVDFTINQFLAETFAIGFRGYYYRQVTGDSGRGARLGDFQGESLGIGPGVFWQPKFAGGKLVILAKWLHDVTTTRRLEADYYSLAFAWTF